MKSTNLVIKMTWCANGGISKIFFLDHFSPSFLGQKYSYSILTGQTKVEFVIYWVLRLLFDAFQYEIPCRKKDKEQARDE